ncbi:MAG: cupin domain-containing protein [Pseudomonadota bacterium]
MSKHIVTKADIEHMDGLAKSHFLNPDAQRVNKSLGDLTGITGFGFHIIEVPPGRSPSECHAHRFEDECIYVLSGTADAVIGADTHRVGAGDFIGYPAGGEAHMITNVGDDTLTCIVVGERRAHDVADYPRLQKRLYRNGSEPWNLVDMADIETPQAGKKA